MHDAEGVRSLLVLQELEGGQVTRFEAIEASRKARGEPDPTAVKQPEPTQPSRAWKRSIYAWLSSPRPPTFVEPSASQASTRKDSLGRRIGLGSGGGKGRGIGGMSTERRREISRIANAARWGK